MTDHVSLALEVSVPAIAAAVAGALCLSFGAAPLGVILIARRMSLIGDALSHAILPGAAIAFLLAGSNPLGLTLGALVAALVVAGAATFFSRGGSLPEDAAFAVLYLSGLALGVMVLGHGAEAETLDKLLFGAVSNLDPLGLLFSAFAASVTLIALALFMRGFVAEAADPLFTRAQGVGGMGLHFLLMALVALNLVAGFRAFGALMTVGLMMIPAAGARYFARGFAGQIAAAAIIALLASLCGVGVSILSQSAPGAAMVLSASVLFGLGYLFGPQGGLLRRWPGLGHLEG